MIEVPKELNSKDIKIIDDRTYYVHSFEQLSTVVDNVYWPAYGQSDRGSCVDFYKETFTYPTVVKLSNYYSPDGELYKVNIEALSPDYIRKLYAAL